MTQRYDNHDKSLESNLKIVENYLQWWDTAGLQQHVGDVSRSWLHLEQSAKKANPKSIAKLSNQPADNTPQNQIHVNDRNDLNIAQKPLDSSLINSAQTISSDAIDPQQWPQDLDTLHAALAEGEALPGNIYGDERGLPRIIKAWHAGANDPVATDDPELDRTDNIAIMIISDFPNADDLSTQSICSGKQEELIVNMMTACEFQKHNIYIASLATTRPPLDELPKQDIPQLAAFMRHHIALVKPHAIICTGSAACNALLNADLMNSRESLHYFNHNNINTELLTIFHLRSLLAKPQLKRQAWRDLQVLIQKDIL